jgi:hypothetical protein
LIDGVPVKYGASHSTIDLDAIIRRSELELPHYELKQGVLRLDDSKTIDNEAVDGVIQTISAIANNGKDRDGKLLIGVADKPADARRVKDLYGINAREVSSRHVVGVKREADALGDSLEKYFSRWKNAIRNSGLTEGLKQSILSAVDYHDYYGLGVIIITIPPQNDLSYVDGRLFVRESDETVEVSDPQKIAAVSRRFFQ